MRRAKQRVSKDRALAEIAGDSGTKQEVIHVLLRAGGKAQRGKAGQLLGVAAEVGGDAEMASEVQCALGFPSIEIAAKVEIAAPQAGAAEIIVGMKQGVSPKMVPRVATWLVSSWAKLNSGRHKMAENKIARKRMDGSP